MNQSSDLEIKLNQMLSTNINTRCYINLQYGYPIHIICTEFSGNELENEWRNLSNSIALILQAHMQNPVERYNIYLLIFDSHISTDLRETIESDKYCCRKIVISESMPEENDLLENLIKNRLFNFTGDVKPSNEIITMESLVNSIDPSGRLHELILNLKTRISEEDVQKAINILL